MEKYFMYRQVLIVAILVFAVSGCAALQDKKTEERLFERVSTYWEARKNNDFETIYKLEAASLEHDESIAQAMRKRPIADILAYEIEEIQIKDESNEAQIWLKVEYKYLMPGFPRQKMKSRMGDKWEFIKGDWYHKRIPLLRGKESRT
jgi:hypothetical protein